MTDSDGRIFCLQNDSDDDQCALSDKWQYERKSRRWSRVVEITPQAQRRLQVFTLFYPNINISFLAKHSNLTLTLCLLASEGKHQCYIQQWIIKGCRCY